MNIQDEIANHKAGKITLREIKRPQFICKSDDDYIEYINYCWSFIELAQKGLSKVSFYNDDGHFLLASVVADVSRAHGILELCHKFLRKDFADLPKYFPQVYTSTMDNDRRLGRKSTA